MSTTVAELFTLMSPYIRACVAFNYTPRDGIGAAESEVTAAMEPLKAALTELVEERDRLRFALDGVNAMREVAGPAIPEGALVNRATELHEKASMPWEQAIELAMSEQGISLPLYQAINKLVCQIGCDGSIDSDHALVTEVMDALHDLDGGTMLSAAPQPPAGQQDRGEALRWAAEQINAIDDGDSPAYRHCQEFLRELAATDSEATAAQQEPLSILATFVHEIWMGAYPWSVASGKARIALERAGLLRLEDVVALSSAAPANGEGAG